MHWFARGTGTPKNRDEVNKQRFASVMGELFASVMDELFIIK
jgi:hypothetical protein